MIQALPGVGRAPAPDRGGGVVHAGPSSSCFLDFEALFGNSNPVEVDLGCGKGAFLAAEAARRRTVNFLGVDRITRKVRRACQRVQRQDLENVRLLRCEANDLLAFYLPPQSISVFHIYFPDPWPKKKHQKRRYLTVALREALVQSLQPGGTILLATDVLDYFEQMQEIFHAAESLEPCLIETSTPRSLTDFEQEFLKNDRPIHRLAYGKRKKPFQAGKGF